jgi:hypothetical protein
MPSQDELQAMQKPAADEAAKAPPDVDTALQIAALQTKLGRLKSEAAVHSSEIVVPPVSILKAIVEEARNQHDDILTEESWNPEYTLEISLKVSEIRKLADWLKRHNIV